MSLYVYTHTTWILKWLADAMRRACHLTSLSAHHKKLEGAQTPF